jgi:hypothetical protein
VLKLLIKWCNNNNGFVSAILALFSIILSFLAIIVSVIVSKYPFKKKIAVCFYTNIGVGEKTGINFYSVEATNIGNRVVKVLFVGFSYKEKKKWINVYSSISKNSQNVMLNINETAVSKYSIDEMKEIMKQKNLYAIAIDIEGKFHKKRIKGGNKQ